MTALRCVVALLLLSSAASAQEAGTAVYVRADTDETTVVTPRMRVQTPVLDETTLELVYTVDVWTSASIDIRTSASRVLTEERDEVVPIVEQRDEIDVSIQQELFDLRIAGGYRYSTEPDYESHGANLGLEMDLADRNTTLAIGGAATFDDVGRVGDPNFSRDSRLVSARLGYTQVLDGDTLVQGIYEFGRAQGLLSSVYRFVGIGGKDVTCRGTVTFCIPESNPTERVRHALAVRGRRALGDLFSIGAGYRFYIDDWDVTSHTANLSGAWLPEAQTSVSLRYRLYWQSEASHYRASYPELKDGRGLYTSDKELSPLSAHRIMLDLERSWELDATGQTLRTALSAGPTFYAYRDYGPLDDITALEVTLSMVLEL